MNLISKVELIGMSFWFIVPLSVLILYYFDNSLHIFPLFFLAIPFICLWYKERLEKQSSLTSSQSGKLEDKE